MQVRGYVDTSLNTEYLKSFHLSLSLCRTQQLVSQTGRETASRWQQGAQTNQQLVEPVNLIGLKQVALQCSHQIKCFTKYQNTLRVVGDVLKY